MIRIELPLPPTANNAYPTNWKTKRRYLSSRARDWKKEAGLLLILGRSEKISGPYTFSILIPTGARGDSDGYIKLPQDLLVEHGVTPDDRKAIFTSAMRSETVPKGRCVVIVGAAP